MGPTRAIAHPKLMFTPRATIATSDDVSGIVLPALFFPSPLFSHPASVEKSKKAELIVSSHKNLRWSQSTNLPAKSPQSPLAIHLVRSLKTSTSSQRPYRVLNSRSGLLLCGTQVSDRPERVGLATSRAVIPTRGSTRRYLHRLLDYATCGPQYRQRWLLVDWRP